MRLQTGNQDSTKRCTGRSSMKRFCKFPDCPNLIESGTFCPDHERKGTSPDGNQPKVADPFYSSVAWRKLREWHISGNPLCVECGAPGVIVDHIQAIKEGGSEMSTENLRTLCRTCHGSKHPKQRTAKRKYSYDGLENYERMVAK